MTFGLGPECEQWVFPVKMWYMYTIEHYSVHFYGQGDQLSVY